MDSILSTTNGKINVEWSCIAHQCTATGADGYPADSRKKELKQGDVIRVSDLRGFNLVVIKTTLTGVKCRLHEMHDKNGVYDLPFINTVKVWKLKTK